MSKEHRWSNDKIHCRSDFSFKRFVLVLTVFIMVSIIPKFNAVFLSNIHLCWQALPLNHLKSTTAKSARMAPLISPTCSLPGRPRCLGFPSECPINFMAPLMSLHLSPHHPSFHNHSSSPPCLIIITPGPRRIHQARPPHSLTTPGPGRLESLQAVRLCGGSSTRRSRLLRGECRRLQGGRPRGAAHRAQREREVVGPGAAVYPRNWTSNQVGKENTMSWTSVLAQFAFAFIFLSTYFPPPLYVYILCLVRLSSGPAESSESSKEFSQTSSEKRKKKEKRGRSQRPSSDRERCSSQE